MDIASSQKRHIDLQLSSQNLNHPTYPVRPKASSHTEQRRSPDADSSSTKRQRFDYVRTTPDAAIYEYLHVLSQYVRRVFINFHECKERRLRRVLGTASMVREDDAVHFVIKRDDSIFVALDAFDDNW